MLSLQNKTREAARADRSVATASTPGSAHLPAVSPAGGRKVLQGVFLPPKIRPAAGLHPGRVVQRIPVEKAVTGITHLVRMVGGSLYNENYRSNEVAEVSEGAVVEIETSDKYRSRRGPNQETFSEKDKTGPQAYRWFRVLHVNRQPMGPDVYIREDTFRDLTKKEQESLPIRSTVYGTADSNKAEIAAAYREGYRDFDCAFSYFKGGTPELFSTLAITSGIVRIIYKLRLEEAGAAEAELGKLSSIKGVYIHTVMLHDLPKNDEEIPDALRMLGEFSSRYHCLIGLSNVLEVRQAKLASNLSELISSLESMGLRLSVIENRVNPAIPDEDVRGICRSGNIMYMGYGLTGPSVAGGTCGMVPGFGSRDYQLLKDPTLAAMAKDLGLDPQDVRYLIYTWAREQQISVIARSSNEKNRSLNRKDVSYPGFARLILSKYGAVGDKGQIYPPFGAYLKLKGVSNDAIQELALCIGPEWLESYYKKAIAEFDDDALAVLVKDPSGIGKIKSAKELNEWKDVTAMREWARELAYPKSALGGPDTLTSEELLKLVTTDGFGIYNEDTYANVNPDLESLQNLDEKTTITLHFDNSPKATFKKQDKATGASDARGCKWEKQ